MSSESETRSRFMTTVYSTAGDSDDSYETIPSFAAKSPVPVRSIALALVLSLAGVSLFTYSLVSVWQTGQLFTDHHYVLITLTFLMLVPGLYHVYLAMNAYFGFPGYSYEDIPTFD